MSQIVKLSQETRELLKVAATINNSIAIEAGNSIKTVSAGGGTMMEAEIGETFPEAFSIYDMSRFLSVLSLPNLKDAELIFDNKDYVEIKQGKTSVKYKFTDNDFVRHPGRTLSLPDPNVEFDLTSTELNNIQKMASALGHKFMVFKVKDGKAYITTLDPSLVEASDDSLVELADVPGSADGNYRLRLEYMILPQGDYRVSIVLKGTKGVVRFTHKTQKVNSYLALEVETGE